MKEKQCACCGGKNKFKKVTNKVDECKYCSEWMVVDEKGVRPATLEECAEASFEVNSAALQNHKEDEASYNGLLCRAIKEDLVKHCSTIEAIVNREVFSNKNLEDE